MHGKNEKIDLTGGDMAPSILRFTLPLIAANLLQVTFNAADVIVVGKFVSDRALAAVTSTTAPVNMLINASFGLSMGCNVVTAQSVGARNDDRLRRTVHTAVLLALLCGAVLMAAGLLLAVPILRGMGSPAEVLPLSALYLRIYFLGVPAAMLYNFGAAVLRGVGDTRRPTRYLILAGALNVVMNLAFVVGLGMGVAGVAVATTASNWVSAVLVLRALLHEEGPARLFPRQVRIDREIMGTIARMGLPACFSSIVIALSHVVLQSSVNSLGEAVMAGSGAWASVENILNAASTGFYNATLTFSGANLSAGRTDRVDSAARWILLMATGATLAQGALAMVFARPLLGIYVDGEAAIQAGLMRMRMTALPMALMAASDQLSGFQRGMGHSLEPTAGYIFTLCAFRLLWCAVVFRARPTAFVLFLSYPISWVLSAACNALLFRRIRRREFARIARSDQKGEEARPC